MSHNLVKKNKKWIWFQIPCDSFSNLNLSHRRNRIQVTMQHTQSIYEKTQIISMKEPWSSRVIHWELRNNFPLPLCFTGVLLISTSCCTRQAMISSRSVNYNINYNKYGCCCKPIRTRRFSFQVWFIATVLLSTPEKRDPQPKVHVNPCLGSSL